jgi:PST family polysaccharide transporter
MNNFPKLKGNRNYKKVFENAISLYLLNIANYIFPLILIPYLIRVLGVENYGSYVFAYTVITYLGLIVRYGFDFSATRQVAIIRDDPQKINTVFSAVLIIQLFLTIVSVIFLLALILFVEKISAHKTLYFYGVGILLGTALFPAYLFQGMENMKYITVINFIIKFISIVLIFILINTPADFELVLLLQSLGSVIGGIVSFILVFHIFKMKFIWPKGNDIILQLKDGWSLFVSTIGMSFYREFNIIILGFMTDDKIVGLYAPAEKMAKVAQSFTNPVVNALYPYMGRKFGLADNKQAMIQQFDKIGCIYAGILLLITIISISLSNLVVSLFVGFESVSTVWDLRILSFIILFGGLNYYYGMLGLVNLGKAGNFSKYVWIAGTFSILSCYILVKYMQDQGAAIAMVLAEIVLLTLIYNKLLKCKKQ